MFNITYDYLVRRERYIDQRDDVERYQRIQEARPWNTLEERVYRWAVRETRALRCALQPAQANATCYA